MKKAWVFLVVGVLFISSAFAVVSVIGRGHSGSEISFLIKSTNKITNLQSILDSGESLDDLNGSPTSLVVGHGPSEVYVNVGGTTMTLKDAFEGGKLRDTPMNKSPAI